MSLLTLFLQDLVTIESELIFQHLKQNKSQISLSIFIEHPEHGVVIRYLKNEGSSAYVKLSGKLEDRE